MTPTPDGFRLQVRLTPGARQDALEGPARDSAGRVHLAARVRAAPEKGAANEALTTLLARALGVPKSAVSVARGGTSRLKTVAVAGGPAALAAARALLGETP